MSHENEASGNETLHECVKETELTLEYQESLQKFLLYLLTDRKVNKF
jgi:hypothetical protein